MTRRLTFVLAVALVAAACGGADGSPAASSPSEPQTTVVASGAGNDAGTTTIAVDSTSDPGTTAAASPEGPDAPDFSLALSDGGEFVLSAEQKPVYMVFWAEW